MEIHMSLQGARQSIYEIGVAVGRDERREKVTGALWSDLCGNSPEEAAPEWHVQVLAERERRLASGRGARLGGGETPVAPGNR